MSAWLGVLRAFRPFGSTSGSYANIRSMIRNDGCRFAEVHESGEVVNPCDQPGRLRPVRYLLREAILCDLHAAVLDAADALPRVGEWMGRRWFGVADR